MIEIFIILFAFTLRVLPRVFLKNSWNTDTYFHMAFSRIIRENSFKIPESKKQISLPDRVDYPWLFHWIFAFIPDDYLKVAEKTSSAMIDMIHIYLAIWFSNRFLSNISFENAEELSLWIGFFIAIVPSFLRVGMGPRAYNATPRVLSQLLFTIFFSCIVLWYQEDSILWIGLSVISASLLFLSSRFGIQALLFISIVLMIMGYIEVLILLIAGFLLSLLFFKKHILWIYEGHFNSMKYYYTTLADNFTGLKEQKGCIGCYFQRMKENFMTKKMINWFFMDQYPLHILVFFIPQIWILFIFNDSIAEEYIFIYDIIIASLVVFLLVLIPKFIFIGEAERYLEHTVFFQIFLFIVLFHNNESVLYILASWFLLCYTQYIRLYIKYNSKNNNIGEKIAPFLKEIDKENNIVYPLGGYSWILLYYLKYARVCYPASSWNTVISKNDLDKLVGNYPYPGVDLYELKLQFGITHIVTDINSFNKYKELIKESKNYTYDILSQNDIYIILKLK
ncbi:MAG: hypothetical protein U9N59_09595 [Campylobacterota bacterium]|nr:hypothetical protein [Campylobacterota bacterium]